MRVPVTAFALSLALVSPALAKEGGCLKYGAAGAVAGHMVGSGHGVAGAAVGCAVGAHERKKAERRDEQQQQQQSQAPQNQGQSAPSGR